MSDDKKRLGIKSWSVEDRPREKLLSKGAKHLTSAELFAILISTGTKEKTALDLSKELLDITKGSLDALGNLSVSQLMKIKGIGEAKAITIAAALEIGRRRKDEPLDKKPNIVSSKDVFEYMYPFFADSLQENFYIILLKRSNQIISVKQISIGGISGTLVDPKIIFRFALEESASSIVLCHNHPSGNIKPSQPDIDITNKIKNGAKYFDISILDHVIFTNNAYFSFADEGLL